MFVWCFLVVVQFRLYYLCFHVRKLPRTFQHQLCVCVFFCYVEVDRYFSQTQFFISVWLSEGGKYVQAWSRLLAKLVVFHDLWPNYPAKLEKIQIVARWLFDDVFFVANWDEQNWIWQKGFFVVKKLFLFVWLDTNVFMY